MEVTNADSVQSVVDQVLAAYGRLDILVNSHGLTKRAPAVDFLETDWDGCVPILGQT
jgi:NAD(P)-dependent dehydrogenase (short-subunit alcohol dehydrogenase family)